MYYNNYPYYPATYNPQIQQNNPQMMQAQAPQNQTQMINTDFVKVHSELEARNYPVGTGNSVTFKDENAPFIYTKTMGFSQLDIPVFEKYRLVKEDSTPQGEVMNEKVENTTLDEIKAEIEDYRAQIYDIQTQINDMQTQIDDLKKKSNPSRKRTLREDLDDE